MLTGPQQHAPGGVVARWAEQKSERREHARKGRDNHSGHLEVSRQCRRMKAAGAAEGHQRSIPRIGTFLHRNSPDRSGHMGFYDFDHAEGRFGSIEAGLLAEPIEGCCQKTRAKAVEQHRGGEMSR